MQKRKSLLSFWSPFTIRHVGFTTSVPLQQCVNELSKYVPHDPKRYHWLQFRRITTEWNRVSDTQCEFTIRHRTNHPAQRYYFAAAALTGWLEMSDEATTSVCAEARTGRVQILLSFSLILIGLLLFSQATGTNLLISVMLFILAIFYWWRAVAARDHLAKLIQDDLMQVEENLNRIAKLRRGEQ